MNFDVVLLKNASLFQSNNSISGAAQSTDKKEVIPASCCRESPRTK